MSEQQGQQTEKKKGGIAKRIFKWFWYGLLILLLIASIIFQAPWKVTALFAIFTASYFLPKPHIKYFLLCVGGVVIGLIIWVFLPETNEGWRPYAFDEELATLEAKYAIPDQENATLIYNQLLEDYNEAAFEPNFSDPNLEDLIQKEYWTSRDWPEAAQWLEQKEGTIAKLIEASKIEQCRFPINADIVSFSDTVEKSGAMRRWASLLIFAANNDIAEGRTKDGLEKYIVALKMGKHVCQQPAIIDLLTGIGLEARSTNQLKRFIVTGDATKEHLSVIEKALTEIKHDWRYDWPRILDYEKLLAKNFLGIFYEVNTEGKTRFIRDQFAATRPSMEKLLDSKQIKDQEQIELLKSRMYPTYWYKKLMKALTIWAWFFMPATPQKAGEVINAKYEAIYAMAYPNFDWGKKTEKPNRIPRINYPCMVKYLTSIMESAFYGIHDTYLRHISQQRGTLLTIALRRYKNKTGHWPESLDEVKSLATEEIFVDTINGGQFVYKLTDENFTLYSKGKNNIDEDGQYNSTWDPNSLEDKIEEDDWLIWPTAGKKHKVEKENNDDK